MRRFVEEALAWSKQAAKPGSAVAMHMSQAYAVFLCMLHETTDTVEIHIVISSAIHAVVDNSFDAAVGHRLLLGVEKLALQGVFPKQSVVAQCSDQFLGDLAGQAFCAPVVLQFALC